MLLFKNSPIRTLFYWKLDVQLSKLTPRIFSKYKNLFSATDQASPIYVVNNYIVKKVS